MLEAIEVTWIAINQIIPPRNKELLFTGNSGYRGIERFIVNGKYDPEYRPLSPYLDATNTCLEDAGWVPTHWAFIKPSSKLL